jgi:hypothetical protein
MKKTATIIVTYNDHYDGSEEVRWRDAFHKMENDYDITVLDITIKRGEVKE